MPHIRTPRPALPSLFLIARMVILLAIASVASSCARSPVIDDRYAPEHIVVQHIVPSGETPETIADAESAASEACQRYDRIVDLPASDNFCITRHWYFGNCMVHRYTFDCLQSQ